MTTKLYVGNLPPETSEEQMRDLFGSFGDVEEVAVFNKPGGDPGFAFVVRVLLLSLCTYQMQSNALGPTILAL